MKKTVMIGLFLAMVCSSYSQLKTYSDFGNVIQEEIDLKRYEPDTTAEALFLYDIGRSYFEYDYDQGFLLHFKHRFKIKIFNKAGFDWANVEIPLRKVGYRVEELSSVRANSYNMGVDGLQRTSLIPSQIFKEDRSSNWKIAKFAMPDIHEGTLIEVEYEIVSPFMFYFHNWEFQKGIPVLYSEYTASMIPFYTYTFLLQGKNRFDEQMSRESDFDRTVAGVTFKDMDYRFVNRNIEAFRDEPFITCPDDYKMKLNFQLCEFRSPEGSKTSYLSTWPKFCSDMLSDDNFGKKINDAENKCKTLLKSMPMPDSIQERTQKIYDYVVSNFKWDGYSSKYTDVKVGDFIKTRTGSTADINLFLIGMLRAAGIEAYPVLISTRDHGKFKVDYPFDFFFNYVVAAVMVDGRYDLLDATESTIGFGKLPSRCINERGFLIKDKKNFTWVRTNEVMTSVETYVIDINPTVGADSADCSVQYRATGHFGMKQRNLLQSNKSTFEKALLGTDMGFSSAPKISNETEPLKALRVDYQGRILQNGTDGTLWVKPFCGFVPSGNPLKRPARQFPIDITFKQRRHFGVTVHIPEGFALSQTLTFQPINDENILLDYQVKIVDSHTVMIQAAYEFRKDVYDASLYKKMKDYFRQIDQIFNQTLVLVRKT
jgi:hypothetical protein